MNFLTSLLASVLLWVGLASPARAAEPPAGALSYYQKTKQAIAQAAAQVSDHSAHFEVGDLRWQQIDAFRGHAPAILVQFDVASEKRTTYAHIAIIDGQGTLIMAAPGGETSFKDVWNVDSDVVLTHFASAEFIDMGKGQRLFALCGEPDGHTGPGSVVLYNLEKDEHKLLEDPGHPAGVVPSSLHWEAAYLFKDIDQDGRKEILINRRVRDATDGELKVKNQKFIFGLSDDARHLVPLTHQYAKRLVEIFQAAKRDPSSPSIELFGLPTQSDAPTGELIFPDEEPPDSTKKYQDVQAHDLDDADPPAPWTAS